MRLIEAHGGESVVLTLGPPEAEEQLRDAMALGVDRAIHLVSDGEEWDPQATAGAIVDAIRADEAANGPFDLVFFGNESADSGNYQVGIRVAYALGRPSRQGSRASAVEGDDRPLRAGGRRRPRRLRAAAAGRRRPCSRGSTCRAIRPCRRSCARSASRVDAELAGAAGVAAREGAARRARGPGQGGGGPRPRAGGGAGGRRGPAADRGRMSVLVFVEERRASSRSRRSRSRARSRASRCTRLPSATPSCRSSAASRRSTSRSARRSRSYAPAAIARALVELVGRLSPDRGRRGRQRAGQRGARARRGEARPAVRGELRRGDSRRSRCSSRACAGAAACSRRRASTGAKLLTVQPHAVAAEAARRGEPRRRDASRRSSPRPTSSCASSSASQRHAAASRSPTRRSSSRAGAAPARRKGFGIIEELAGLLGGAVGCSRAVTMAGWRPHTDQVGQTGTKIAPEIYIACGISGATQHMAGCKGAKAILAVNTDPEAPILASADYAVIGDLHEVVPAISAELRKARAAEHRRERRVRGRARRRDRDRRRALRPARALPHAARPARASRSRVPRTCRPASATRRRSSSGSGSCSSGSCPASMHAFIFWGFLVLFPTIFMAIVAIVDREPCSRPDPARLAREPGLVRAIVDVFAVLVLVGVVTALWIRKVQRPRVSRGRASARRTSSSRSSRGS